MNPASVDIKDILVAESSLGLTFATDLFIGKEPDSPDNCVTIFDIPGYGQEIALDGPVNYYYPAVQIQVRNNGYVAGWSLIDSIRTLLHGKNNETWNGTLYCALRCTTEPALLKWDDNQRAHFFTNVDIERR